MTSIWVKVVDRSQEAPDIISLDLADAAGGLLPPFSAGAHVDVHLPGGLIRQYSLFNAPTERHRYRIAVLRGSTSRGGAIAAHQHLTTGTELRISSPRNHFALIPAERVLLLAGGIGITPLLSMAEHLSRAGGDFQLRYCARSPRHMAFAEHIRRSPFGSRAQFHPDDGPVAQRLDLPAALAQAGPGGHLYVCGPAGFMDWVIGGAKAAGWPPERIHFEYFTAAPVDTPGDGGFEVELARSGRVVPIPPDRSVAETLRSHGIAVPLSCEAGVCGTCVTRVIAGIPDHRDLFMTEAEHAANNQFTPCCSRARSSRLVLDL